MTLSRIITALLLVVACAAPLSAQSRITHREYIDSYLQYALEDQRSYRIPASIKMAQALLESDCGNSRLAREGNNHFGIKCKSDWTGLSMRHDDDAPQECFRKYGSPYESFRDHSEFLTGSARYADLFVLEITDYKGWARGLKAAGYATNPSYADLLIRIIEEHELYLLDSDDGLLAWNNKRGSDIKRPAGTTPKLDLANYTESGKSAGGYTIYLNNGSEFVVAQAGDTYASLAKTTRVSQKRLRKFNDASPSAEPSAAEMIYIKAKGNRAENGRVLHMVRSGESIRSISQVYGIKMSKLARLNRISADASLSEGQQIRLM